MCSPRTEFPEPWIVGVHRDRPEGLIWSPDERLPVVVRERDPLRLRIPGTNPKRAAGLDEFRAELGMTWPFHIIYTDDFHGAITPEIVDASGFPVTAFLRSDHTVAAVHTGFISKAAEADPHDVRSHMPAHSPTWPITEQEHTVRSRRRGRFSVSVLP